MEKWGRGVGYVQPARGESWLASGEKIQGRLDQSDRKRTSSKKKLRGAQRPNKLRGKKKKVPSTPN